jgi:membrane associated rhomboid family serine protease
MLIPLGTDRSLRRPTLVNQVLVSLNVSIFLAGAVLERVNPAVFQSLQDRLVLDPGNLTWWSFISHAFLHAGFLHLAGNMIFLWVFGPNVEDRFGRVGYLLFYLAGAVLAGATQIAWHPRAEIAPGMTVPIKVLGASGAIAAVTGAYLVLFPHTRVKTLILFFFIGIYEIPAWWILGGQIAWNVFAQGSGMNGNVAVLAHLAGYAWGITVSMLLLATGTLPREPYDLFTMSRQAVRRRQFREAHFQASRAREKGLAPDGTPRDAASADTLAQARAEVTVHMPTELPQAAAAYKGLLEKHGATTTTALLSRRSQYDLANHLFESGDYSTAATAYQLFLEGYPNDAEVPMVRLLLGLINARYLNDPVKAKAEIGRALPGLAEGPRNLAKELLAELG